MKVPGEHRLGAQPPLIGSEPASGYITKSVHYRTHWRALKNNNKITRRAQTSAKAKLWINALSCNAEESLKIPRSAVDQFLLP